MPERLRINTSWLIALRWAAVAGQLVTIFAVEWGLKAGLALAPLMTIIVSTALTNLLLAWWARKTTRQHRWAQSTEFGNHLLNATLILDIILLAALLYWTGGAHNPFSLFFLVNLSLAAVIVEFENVALMALLSVVCFGALFIWRHPLPVIEKEDMLRGLTGFISVRSEGLFVAFSAASVAITYFMARLSKEIRDQDAELVAVRQRESRREKLEALGTLAAGAAHELATPLSTIAVVAKELERTLETSGASTDAIEDARLIRSELTQCRLILDRMAGRAGESVGEGIVEITLEEMLREMTSSLPGSDRIRMDSTVDACLKMPVPRVALGQALRGIVKNALDATLPTRGDVTISTRISPDYLIVEVKDTGPGMNEDVLARVGEPFFTTKSPGEGMGLGMFLTRAVIERLGGQLDIRSVPKVGTTVEVLLPRRVPSMS